jgi:hypothetical protein
MRIHALVPLAPVAAALLMIVSACSDELETTGPGGFGQAAITTPPSVPPGPPADAKPVIIAFPTAGGSAGAGTTTLLEVLLTDRKGNPVAGRSVTWTSTNGGTLNPAESVTDASGFAASSLTVTHVAGTQHVITAQSGSQTATTTVTVLAGPAFVMAAYGSNPPTEQVGNTRTISVVVTDVFGNPVADHDVNWFGDGVSPLFSKTGANGVASVNWTAGQVAGQFQAASASAYGEEEELENAPIDFTMQTIAGPPAVIEIDPESRTITGFDNEKAWFSAQVFDGFDNQIGNAPIQWSISSGGNATIDQAGLVTVSPQYCGSTVVLTVTAASGEATQNALLTVVPSTFCQTSN